MERTKISSFILLITILGFTSCRTTFNMSKIEVELMKPGQLTLPEDVDTIALFTRDSFQSDTMTFTYKLESKNILSPDKLLSDTTIHYSDLSNKCVDNLVNYFENENYFLKVINYRDSFNYMFTGTDIQFNSPELHKKLGADAFIFLDYFHLWDYQIQNMNTDFYNIQDAFPEFKKCKLFEYVYAKLIWNIFIKGDTTRYTIEQPDDLYYGNNVNPEYFGNSINHRQLLENASIFLGNSIGAKLLPSWKKVERIYYKSDNVQMLQAESFLRNNDWLKAAEIYNKKTKNKNRNVASKAKYNMALVCEMEGNLDAAIDWLLLSKTVYKRKNPEHKFNCDQYCELLELRKKEIELLGKQVRE